MNKTLAITAIVLVAIVMGMSTIAPAMAWMPEADHREKACKAFEENEFRGVTIPQKAKDKVCHTH